MNCSIGRTIILSKLSRVSSSIDWKTDEICKEYSMKEKRRSKRREKEKRQHVYNQYVPLHPAKEMKQDDHKARCRNESKNHHTI